MCLFEVGIAWQSIAWHSMAWDKRAEQSRAEQSRAEQSRAEQSRAEQSRAEQSRANELEPVPQHFIFCNKQIGPTSWCVTLQLDGKTCYVQTL
jgi:hypothetical protein